METLNWHEVNGSGVFWTQDKKSHAFILKFPSSHPSASTFTLLEKISGYSALAKRLEIYAKSCSPRWERNFRRFLNLIPLQLDKKFMEEITCISLILDDNLKEFGNLADLSMSLLNLECGLLTTTKGDDLSNIPSNMFLIYFDDLHEENFKQMLSRFSFAPYIVKSVANGNGESSHLRGPMTEDEVQERSEKMVLPVHELLQMKRKRDQERYHSLIKKWKEDEKLIDKEGKDPYTARQMAHRPLPHKERIELLTAKQLVHRSLPRNDGMKLYAAKQLARQALSNKAETSKRVQFDEKKITSLDVGNISITDLLGEKEPNYVIEDLISAGEFGIKTCLRHREDNSRLVMKVVAFSNASSMLIKSTRFDCMAVEGNKESCPNIVTIYGHRILQEAAQLSGFCSSNLSQFLSSFRQTIEKANVSLFVFEERCGLTVQDWLTQHDMEIVDKDYKLREKIAEGVVSGLNYLHGKEIVHSDLKLENIYFTSDYQCPVKIADYETNEVKCSGAVSKWQQALLNTQGGDEKVADWFSFGIILFQLFYTQNVISDIKFPEVLDSVRQIVTEISELPGLKSIVLGLTGVDGSERDRIINELRQDTSKDALLVSTKVGQPFSVFRVTHNSMCS